MSEIDVGDGDTLGRADSVVVVVPPPDGLAIVTALRERGFIAGEAPLSLLAPRVLAEAPRVMIVDVDLPGAVEAIERVREVSASVELLCVGDPVRAAELGASRADGRSFERPLDVEALSLSVLALAEPARSPVSRGTIPPAMSLRLRETSPPRAQESELPPGSEHPSTGDPLDMAVLLPALDDPEAFAAAPRIDFSPELNQILESAEMRVSSLHREHPSSIPSPDEDVDLMASADMLAALDEPLDPEDDPSGASTGGFAKHTGEGTSTGAAGGSIAGEATRAGVVSALPAVSGSAPPASLATFAPPPEPEPVREAPAPIATPAPPAPPPGGSYPAPTLPEQARMPVVPPIKVPAVAPVAPIATPPPPRPAVAPPAMPPLTQAKAPIATPLPPRPPEPPAPALPRVLGEGDAVRAVASTIAARASGSLALGPEGSVRRVVLHEGDIVTAASGSPDETLLAFLAARGDIERGEAARLAGKLPAHGRHAGAALIAHGHLGQDDLWPVLRAHAEWIIGRALLADEGTCELEPEPPGRLKAEPSVFGGATGAEVLLEVIRRVIAPEVARRRLGGPSARIAEGPRLQLLGECALRADEEQRVRSAAGRRVGELLDGGEPEIADVLYGLTALGVLEVLAAVGPRESVPPEIDSLDEEALRQRVRARVALVEDGDYFSLLGIARAATGYEIKRAYLELRRAFEPTRVLTAQTADLAADVRLVIEVLDEAYEILREPHRRERYRRAIEAGPP